MGLFTDGTTYTVDGSTVNVWLDQIATLSAEVERLRGMALLAWLIAETFNKCGNDSLFRAYVWGLCKNYQQALEEV
jgi:hypothetical protein